jgi:hypothetical protein
LSESKATCSTIIRFCCLRFADTLTLSEGLPEGEGIRGGIRAEKTADFS